MNRKKKKKGKEERIGFQLLLLDVEDGLMCSYWNGKEFIMLLFDLLSNVCALWIGLRSKNRCRIDVLK